MRKIYACVDIGSHSTKLVVAEKIKNQFVVLSRFIVKSKGIKKGIITNLEEATLCLRELIKKAEDDLGVAIKSLLCTIPSDTAEFSMVNGEILLRGKEIGQEEITKVLQNAVTNSKEDDKVLVSINPVFYKVDDVDNLKDIRGMSGEKLGVKAVIATVSKVVAIPFFSLFKQLGVELVDVELSLVGDYYSFDSSELDKTSSAVINIGYDKTEVGIFNKGILIKAEKIDIGSKMVDKDIAFLYDLERKKCRYLKETFAVCNTRYADVNEVVHIQNKSGQTLTINQLKLSEIVESRVYEILKLAKKQISLLTNREIRYIIVTGGISEIAGFEYTLENVFGRGAVVLNTSNLGCRSNSYSSCFGFIKCFSRRVELRCKTYSMIEDEELENNYRRKNRTTSEGGLGGIINYFTGNKED